MSSINSSQSSGLKTADGIIMARPGKLTSIMVTADNTNAASVILYDNASAASGTVLAKLIVDATSTHESISFTCPIDCLNGIYLDIGGTGAEVIVHYQLG